MTNMLDPIIIFTHWPRQTTWASNFIKMKWILSRSLFILGTGLWNRRLHFHSAMLRRRAQSLFGYMSECALTSRWESSHQQTTLMPCLVSLGPSRKPQEPDDDLAQPQRQLKWLKLSGPRPAYWDNLSKIWLTKETLQEFDRHSSPLTGILESGQRPYQPLTWQPQAALKHHCQTLAVESLNSCKPKNLKEIKRLSRRGGLDLSDLRNCNDSNMLSPMLTPQLNSQILISLSSINECKKLRPPEATCRVYSRP